jgi:hypothetical protein
MGDVAKAFLGTMLAITLGCLAAAAPAQAQELFRRALDYPAKAQPAYVAAGDFDNDGEKDLAVSTTDANEDLFVLIYLGNGDGTFSGPTETHIPPDEDFQEATGISAGDFDGDGNLDLVLTNLGADTVVVLFGGGDGTFGPPVDYDTPLAQADPLSVAVADFDGDGSLDFAAAVLLGFNGSPNIDVYFNEGDGTFGEPVAYDSQTDELTSIAAADFDGDGAPDLAAASQGAGNQGPSNVSVLLNDGSGDFGQPEVYGVGASPQFVLARDLNGDGDPDLVIADQGADGVSVLLNEGDGSFGAAAPFGAGGGSAPLSVASADFDGDGKRDLATANSGTDDVSVLPGRGDGTFGAPEDYAVGKGPTLAGAADLNGDRKPDLVTANAGSGDVSVLVNAARPRISAVRPASGVRGRTVTLTVTGEAFGKGAKVALARRLVGFNASSVAWRSQTTLKAKVRLPRYAPTGPYGVKVTNPDRQDVLRRDAFRIRGR